VYQQTYVSYETNSGMIMKTQGLLRKITFTTKPTTTDDVHPEQNKPVVTIPKRAWFSELSIVEHRGEKFYQEIISVKNNNISTIVGYSEHPVHSREFQNLVDVKRREDLFKLYREEIIPKTLHFYADKLN
jgi:hypothetical protein